MDSNTVHRPPLPPLQALPPLEAVARLVILYHEGGPATRWDGEVDPQLLRTLVRERTEALWAALTVGRAARDWMRVTTYPAAAAAHLIAETGVDPTEVARFLAPTTAPPARDVRAGLARTMRTAAAAGPPMPDRDTIGWILTAWRCWCRGARAPVLVWDPAEDVPAVARPGGDL
jgi:hypothetical protein